MTFGNLDPVYDLLRKTQLELEKAYSKINEYEYMISATPVNDKQLLTRELAHHILKYENLYNSIQDKETDIETKSVHCQTVFWRKEQETSTDKIEFSEIGLKTDNVELKEAGAQIDKEISHKQLQIEPKVAHQLIQTSKVALESQPENGTKSPEIKELEFDISRIAEKAIIMYNITIE